MPARHENTAQLVRLDFDGWVSQVAFSRDGKQFAAATSQPWVYRFDVLKKFAAEPIAVTLGKVSAIAFSPSGDFLTAADYGQDQVATILNVHTGEREELLGHRGTVTSVAYSPKGSVIATASIDQTIRLWDSETRELKKTLSGHKSWVNAIAFLHEGTLVSGSSDGTVKLWDVTTGECTKTLAATKAEVRSIAVSRDGKRIAAGIRYGITKVWDTTDWSETVIEQKADDVWSVVFSADGQQIITAAGEWNKPTDIVFWDIASQKPVKALRHTGEVMSLALSPDGKRLAAGGMDKAVSVWTLEE